MAINIILINKKQMPGVLMMRKYYYIVFLSFDYSLSRVDKKILISFFKLLQMILLHCYILLLLC